MKNDSDLKLAMPVLASILRLLTKFERNWSENFGASDVSVTSCHAISDQKTTKVQTAVELRVLKQIANEKGLKEGDLISFRMAISDFQNF